VIASTTTLCLINTLLLFCIIMFNVSTHGYCEKENAVTDCLRALELALLQSTAAATDDATTRSETKVLRESERNREMMTVYSNLLTHSSARASSRTHCPCQSLLLLLMVLYAHWQPLQPLNNSALKLPSKGRCLLAPRRYSFYRCTTVAQPLR
jgi:hypothetical protein